MKNVFVAVAVMFSVSLLGCGGPDAEVSVEEPTSTTEEVSTSAALRTDCADIDLKPCTTQGATAFCYMVGRPTVCACNGTYWVCP